MPVTQFLQNALSQVLERVLNTPLMRTTFLFKKDRVIFNVLSFYITFDFLFLARKSYIMRKNHSRIQALSITRNEKT